MIETILCIKYAPNNTIAVTQNLDAPAIITT